MHYEALDLVITSIATRFDQSGYCVYGGMYKTYVLVKACSDRLYDSELEHVCTFHDDVNMLQLQAQLPLLQPLIAKEKAELTMFAIIQQLATLSKA